MRSACPQRHGRALTLTLSAHLDSVFPCAAAGDAAALRSYITTYAKHPNQFKYNNRVFASTFAGESCTFGQGSVPQGWATQFTGQLTGVNAVHFVPSFFIDPATFGQFSSSINGMFNVSPHGQIALFSVAETRALCHQWNSGWPIGLTTATANAQLASSGESLSATAPADIEKITSVLLPNVGATTTDSQYVNGLKSVKSNDRKPPTYMGAVSPWFFTHYGPDSFNKNVSLRATLLSGTCRTDASHRKVHLLR